ncbi:hypothetical protein J2Z75_003303 [Rhizobium herbae]|uniref:Uncharacterized protein n=1 Tax=Rhizobium herbae TaxID=508661 RepID=A0ABS4EPB2_9HYPH|nr:hypothetical protein [Rhizobium herbae]
MSAYDVVDAVAKFLAHPFVLMVASLLLGWWLRRLRPRR